VAEARYEPATPLFPVRAIVPQYDAKSGVAVLRSQARFGLCHRTPNQQLPIFAGSDDARHNEACGLGYDENGPLGLPCTEPRYETLVHGLPRAVRDGRHPSFSIVYKRQASWPGSSLHVFLEVYLFLFSDISG
jgi:hypothetical protein